MFPGAAPLNCDGLGSSKIAAKPSKTRKSHKTIAAMSRGSHHAGTSHRNPSSSATKNAAPKPNDNQPWDRPRAATPGGTSGRGELIPNSAVRLILHLIACSLFRHLHGGNNVGDDLIGSKPFQIRFGLEQNAMSQYRQRRSFHIVRQKKIAAVHSCQCAGHEKQADDGPWTAS